MVEWSVVFPCAVLHCSCGLALLFSAAISRSELGFSSTGSVLCCKLAATACIPCKLSVSCKHAAWAGISCKHAVAGTLAASCKHAVSCKRETSCKDAGALLQQCRINIGLHALLQKVRAYAAADNGFHIVHQQTPHVLHRCGASRGWQSCAQSIMPCQCSAFSWHSSCAWFSSVTRI